MTWRLVIVDDHPIVRDGLQGVLSSQGDFAVVGQAGRGSEALAVVAATDPDLVLMDLRMPDGDGFTAIREMRRRGPRPRVLVLTTYDNASDVRRAAAAGADGYLLKDLPRNELVEAVRTLLTDGSSSPALQPHPQAPGLTDREIEVLECVAEGLTNRAMGRRLGISEGTVKTHLAHIYAKLNVQDRAAAVHEAWERGLV